MVVAAERAGAHTGGEATASDDEKAPVVESQRKRQMAELWRNKPLETLGLLGGFYYVVVRLPLSIYYGRLGVTPEEVGISQLVAVARFLPIVLALVGAFLVLSSMIILMAVGTVFSLQERTASIAVIGLAIALTFGALLLDANQSAEAVLEGRRPHTGWVGSELFDAQCVTAQWLGESARPFVNDHLMFLGSADSVTALYDPESDTVLRLPKDKVAMIGRPCRSDDK